MPNNVFDFRQIMEDKLHVAGPILCSMYVSHISGYSMIGCTFFTPIFSQKILF